MEENAPVPNTPAKPLVEVNVQKSLNKSSEKPGYIAVILLFPCVISGAVLGITGVSKWNLPLTYNNSTWFASLAALGAAVGCLISQSVIDAFGPRGSVLLSHVVCATGWILTFSSSTTTYLLVGRTLTGVFVGIVTVAATEQSTECFPFRPAARPIVFNAVGVLCVYLAGSLLNYGQTAGVATVATIVSFVLVRSFVPESPAWLESRGRPGDADYSRLKLRVTRPSDGARMLKGVHRTGYRSTADEAVYQHLHQPDDRSAADEAVYQHHHQPDDSYAADVAVYQHLHQPDDRSAADEAVYQHHHQPDDSYAADKAVYQHHHQPDDSYAADVAVYQHLHQPDDRSAADEAVYQHHHQPDDSYAAHEAVYQYHHQPDDSYAADVAVYQHLHQLDDRSAADEAVYQHHHQPDDSYAADVAVYQHLHQPDDRSAADEAVYQHHHQPDDSYAADKAVYQHHHQPDDSYAADVAVYQHLHQPDDRSAADEAVYQHHHQPDDSYAAHEAVYQYHHQPDDSYAADVAVYQHLHQLDDRSAADEAVYQHHHQPDDSYAADKAVYQHLHQPDDRSAADEAVYQLSDVYRPLITRSMRLALQQMSGPLVLVTYAVKLVNDSGVRVLNGQFVAAMLAAFFVVGAFVSTGINRRASASKLAAAGTLTAVVVITVFNHVQLFGSQLLKSFVPLLCLIVYSMSSSVGPMPRSTGPRYAAGEHVVGQTVAVRKMAVRTMAGEHVVGKTVASRHVDGEHLALAFGYMVAFAVIKCYPYAQAAVGWWVFAFFAVASALNIVYGILIFSKPKSSKQSSDEPAV